MTIETVDQLVAHLKAEGVRFTTIRRAIRAESRVTRLGGRCCPLLAAFPENYRTSNAAAWALAPTLLGMPAREVGLIISAADNAPKHDPAVRAKLLTLVEA